MNRITSSQPSRRLLLASATAFFLVGTGLARARTLTGNLPWEPGTATPPISERHAAAANADKGEFVQIGGSFQNFVRQADQGAVDFRGAHEL